MKKMPAWMIFSLTVLFVIVFLLSQPRQENEKHIQHASITGK
jgi:hypothetical protein